MKLLKTFKDKEPDDPKTVKTRFAARGIFFDDLGRMPLLFVSQFAYHKLPGGGVEEGEDLMQALEREVKEETGCTVNASQELGKINEYRAAWNLDQTSYCYLGKVLTVGEPEFTEREKAQGFKLEWLTLNEAIRTIEQEEPLSYEGIFIQKRDLTFLIAAQTVIARNEATKQSPEITTVAFGHAMKDVRHATNEGSWARGSSEGQRRYDVRPGMKVVIVLKQDQPTGKLTEGIVQDVLTSSANHPRGIKVRLTTGQVGRVQFLR